MVAVYYLPELLLFFSPFLLWILKIFTFIEACIFSSLFIFVFLMACFRKIEFPELSQSGFVSVVFAPEESASRFANRFIRSACQISQFLCDVQYLAIGTPSLVKDTRIKLVYDTSNDSVWGIPNLQQLLRQVFVYFRFARYIVRNQNIFQNVILYSSPDLGNFIFKYLSKRGVGQNIRFIITGLPEKEVITGVVGNQTKRIFKNTHRIILPYSGGLFDDYIDRLKEFDLWEQGKAFRCQSAYVIEYLKDAKRIGQKLDQNDDILLLIGGREPEIVHHLSIAEFVLNKFKDSNYNIVFICPGTKMLEFLGGLFGDRKVARFVLDDDYDYHNARLVICKSGTSTIKPVLYGVPTIPFYLPTFRTKLIIKTTLSWKTRVEKIKVDIANFLLPNMITKSHFLITDFMGSMDFKLLGSFIDRYLESPPDTEAFRRLFASEFLSIRNDNQTFGEIVDKYIESSKKNLKIIENFILEDFRNDYGSDKCPDFDSEYREMKEMYSDDLLTAFQVWMKCGGSEPDILQKFQEADIKILDTSAMLISSRFPTQSAAGDYQHFQPRVG